MTLSFDHTTLGQRVLFSDGHAVRDVGTALAALHAERVLLIADAFAAEIADEIAGNATVVARIDDVIQHVPGERADAAVELATETGADSIVSIGGGSATGLAKMVALRTALPIVAVPTTFAGSEATDVWGVTENKRKTTGASPLVLPRVVVYDVGLSAGLPADAAVASGLNAVAHSVDSLWAPRADPINSAVGAEGLRALVPGLRGLIADAADRAARAQTLYGAYLSAVAFASAGSGMHHKICHVLGGAYDLPHAPMHAVVLPYVVAFNASHAPSAARRISDALDGAPAAAGLWRLREELGSPGSLRALGMREEDISEAAGLALAAIPESNPRPVRLSDMETLLNAAWAGDAVQ